MSRIIFKVFGCFVLLIKRRFLLQVSDSFSSKANYSSWKQLETKPLTIQCIFYLFNFLANLDLIILHCPESRKKDAFLSRH